MKTIYIGKKRRRTGWGVKVIFFVSLILIGMRLAAPSLIAAYVNTKGSDVNGFGFRVEDIGLGVLKGEVALKKFVLYDHENQHEYLEVKNVQMKMSWADFLKQEFKVKLRAKEIDLLISEDLSKEIERIKKEAVAKREDPKVMIKKFVLEVDEFDVRAIDKGKERSILTLNEAAVVVQNTGLGSINEKTIFDFQSLIAGGGALELSGKTKPKDDLTPWDIKGKLSEIPPGVIEKMAGAKLPVEVEKGKLEASIVAHSGGGVVEGEIVPVIKNFKLKVEGEKGFLKKNLAKVANYIFKNSKDKEGEVSIRIPFTLSNELSLDIPDSFEKFRRQ